VTATVTPTDSRPSPPKGKRKMLTYLLIAAGGLAGIVIVLLVIGHFLPPDYSFEVRRRISESPEVVWQRMIDASAYPLSTKMCRGVAVHDASPGQESWTEDMGASSATYTVVESDEPRRRTITAKDNVVPLSFRSVTTLTAVEGGTEVHTVVNGRIENGTWHVPIFRLVIHGIGAAKTGAQQYLDSLATGK
jgi:hypothetical protein